MEKRVASILLMLSLEALLLAAAAAAAGSGGDTGVIRLPSDTPLGLAERATAMARARPGDEERPWTCCDRQLCTRSWPPFCFCQDRLEQCPDACKECGKLRDSDPPRYICKDVYIGEPAPRCHEDEGNKAVHAGPKWMTVVRGSMKGNGERPWKCCDDAVMGPTTGGTVVWYCRDKVEHCTCSSCFELKGSNLYYCLDGYEGSDPGPSCTHA